MDPKAEEQLAAFEEWLTSPVAKSRATAILKKRGLPLHGSDDLCQDAYAKIARRLEAGPLADGSTVAGYAYTTMWNWSGDLLKGPSVRPAQLVSYVDDRMIQGALLVDVADQGVEQLYSSEIADPIRVKLLATPERDVWPMSAALTVLTLGSDPDRDDDLGPRPGSGKETQRRHWTAIWLAGRRELFPGGDVERTDTPALRKRRSRAIAQVEERIKGTRVSFLADAKDRK